MAGFSSAVQDSMGINKTRLRGSDRGRTQRIFRATLPPSAAGSAREDRPVTAYTCCLRCNIITRVNEFMLLLTRKFISHGNNVSEWHIQWGPYSKCHKTKPARWIEPSEARSICTFYMKFINFCMKWCFFLYLYSLLLLYWGQSFCAYLFLPEDSPKYWQVHI